MSTIPNDPAADQSVESSAEAPGRSSRLGRGLAGLVGLSDFGPTEEELVAEHVTDPPSVAEPIADGPAGDGELLEISVESLIRNPYQPRKGFDAEAMQELVDSIAQHGVLSPLLVRPDGGSRYQLIAGERRWKAAREAGLEFVPCQVRIYTDQQVYETAMEENLKREDLNPLEQAQAFRRYLEEFGSTIDQLASRLSMSRSAVSNLLRLLDLSDPVQQALCAGKITAGHARALVTLVEADQLHLCKQIVDGGLTVRATEAAAKAIRDGQPSVVPVPVPVPDPDVTTEETSPTGRPPELSNHLVELQDHLRRQYGTRVEIRLSGAQSGQIVIPFSDGDEFQRVVRAMERRAA